MRANLSKMFHIANLKYSKQPIKMLCISTDEGQTWSYTNIKKFNNSIKDAKLYAQEYIENKKQNEKDFWQRASEYTERKLKN